MKLGMAGPAYRRAKAALSVPLQKFLGASTSPSSKCLCQRWLQRCSWGGSCVLLPWKNHGAWESYTRQTRRSWQTPACRPGSPHPWGNVFCRFCCCSWCWQGEPSGDLTNLVSLQAPSDSWPDSSMLTDAGNQHLWLSSWSRWWIQLSYFMFTSWEQALGKADICNHSALLPRCEDMALQVLLRQQAGFKANIRIWDRRSLFPLNHTCKNNFWAFTLVQFHFKALLLSLSPRLGEGHVVGQQSHPRGSRLSKQLCFAKLEAPNWGRQGPGAACRTAERFRKLWYHHWAIRAVPQECPLCCQAGGGLTHIPTDLH